MGTLAWRRREWTGRAGRRREWVRRVGPLGRGRPGVGRGRGRQDRLPRGLPRPAAPGRPRPARICLTPGLETLQGQSPPGPERAPDWRVTCRRRQMKLRAGLRGDGADGWKVDLGAARLPQQRRLDLTEKVLVI